MPPVNIDDTYYWAVHNNSSSKNILVTAEDDPKLHTDIRSDRSAWGEVTRLSSSSLIQNSRLIGSSRTENKKPQGTSACLKLILPQKWKDRNRMPDEKNGNSFHLSIRSRMVRKTNSLQYNMILLSNCKPFCHKLWL